MAQGRHVITRQDVWMFFPLDIPKEHIEARSLPATWNMDGHFNKFAQDFPGLTAGGGLRFIYCSSALIFPIAGEGVRHRTTPDIEIWPESSNIRWITKWTRMLS